MGKNDKTSGASNTEANQTSDPDPSLNTLIVELTKILNTLKAMETKYSLAPKIEGQSHGVSLPKSKHSRP
ncbi:hypothetical protein I3842_14G049400 [Carya illinoinensis]|uniref:Uncharacterized protein n=1 Tax=Carya illinoinensis TaxID=32201 RepID=A0A922AAI4_CARIL|nr:hypothetical protein I3842_14G049400 [Carya illinoinensis]